jgi:hypothetical protein
LNAKPSPFQRYDYDLGELAPASINIKHEFQGDRVCIRIINVVDKDDMREMPCLDPVMTDLFKDIHQGAEVDF